VELMPSREYHIVGFDELDEVWDWLLPYVKKACNKDFNKFTPEDLKNLILEDKMQLWLGTREGKKEFGIFTDILQFPNKRIGRITVGMGFKPLENLEFLAQFEKWAKEEYNCEGVQSNIHLGFEGMFTEAGWKKTHILMEKEI